MKKQVNSKGYFLLINGNKSYLNAFVDEKDYKLTLSA